jgi:predicted ArsR family transcriptional regulator
MNLKQFRKEGIKNLTTLEVLHLLHTHMQLTRQELAGGMGVSTRTITSVTQTLTGRGYLQVVRMKHKSNIYALTLKGFSICENNFK